MINEFDESVVIKPNTEVISDLIYSDK